MKAVSGFNIIDKEFKLIMEKTEAVYNIDEFYNLTSIIKI